MKRLILLLGFVISVSSMRASDTLTIRQVFNFDVGDTFDYFYENECEVSFPTPLVNPYDIQTVVRYVIAAKTVNLNADTIWYTRQFILPAYRVDSFAVTNLDSPFTTRFNDPNQGFYLLNFDTSRLNDGRYTNRLYTTPFEGGIDYTYGDGVGLLECRIITGDPTAWSCTYDTMLLYYSKGGDTMGAPYYAPHYQYISPHFTPIPEQCASWLRHYSDTLRNQNFYEEIKTGNKLFFDGHVYVELYCRFFDVNTNYLQADSFIGYFRNDTAGMKVYFGNSPLSPDSLLYDFGLYPGQTFTGIGYPFKTPVGLYSWDIRGVNRVTWYYSEYGNSLHERGRGYMEGVGSLQGFILVHQDINPSSSANQSLISFCVCGDALFPDTTSSLCFELTGLYQPNIPANQIHLYPNPTSDLFHLLYPEASQYNARLVITDILGQEVYFSQISDTESTHDISILSSGLYNWQIVANNKILKTGKVIKQ